ncbi:MAG: TIGR00730 family Rossman fold protein [Gammaproteobacteria bacterium]|nr:TIGR00730 family Rossman fold protein [Gammaproteobacteria bacterium]
MPKLKSVAVFCGSNLSNDMRHREAATRLGRCLAEQGITLIYGGSKLGLMGLVADGALERDGAVIGVSAENLVSTERTHDGLTELQVVNTIHQRKQTMCDLAEAFILLPGGIGSWDEFFGVWTWSQLGFHAKPIGVLNIDGFYDDLLAMCQKAVDHGFIKKLHHASLRIADNVESLVKQLMHSKAVEAS